MMRSIIALFISALLFKQSVAQGYQVTLQTKSFQSGIAYLAYHMGKNMNVADSAAINNNGLAVFKGKENLPGGIYAIVFPDKSARVEFFIDKEQKISVNADINNLSKATIKGSKENELFQYYQDYVAVKGRLLQNEKVAYSAALTQKDSLLHEGNYNRLNKELNDFRDSIIKAESKSMMTALLNAMKESPYPKKIPVTKQDSLDNYQFYKSHYWEGITFMDERIVRTPFFLPKLERYYREVLPQSADSIIKDADYKLLLARTAPEMYKFLLNWLTDEYINPKYMGQDAVFVHLFEKYHSKGLSNWLNEKQMEVITRRAYMQMANLIGEKAANLEMIDPLGKPTSLYELNAAFTVVVFWDPNCGHCKEELPRIDSVYKSTWKAEKVKMFAVMTEYDTLAWTKYLADHKLSDWTHVYQTKEMEKEVSESKRPGFRQLYDVTMTPTLYLLDKEKRIIGKKLTWQQLNDLLQVKLKTENK